MICQNFLVKSAIMSGDLNFFKENLPEMDKISTFDILLMCINGRNFEIFKFVWEERRDLDKEQLTSLMSKNIFFTVKIRKYLKRILNE